MRKFSFWTLLFITFSFFFIFHFTQASTLTLSTSNSTPYSGDEFTATLILDTENQIINAGEIYLELPENLIITDLTTPNSILKLWVKEPQINRQVISLIGGIPDPGFIGNTGLLATLKLKASTPGKITPILHPTSQILLHDGFGTPSSLTLKSSLSAVLPAHPGHLPQTPDSIKDTSPPINLVITLGKNLPELGGQWLISFSAEDLETGIKSYEIAEIPIKEALPKDSDWQPASSPYILKNQNKNHKIFVKAIDNAGNFSINHTIFKTGGSILPVFLFFVIIFLLLLIIGWLIWLKLQKKHEQHSKPFSKIA